jgi:hypothetical protein
MAKKKNNSVIVNQLTGMPVLPGRMILNADNQPAAIGVKIATGTNFCKQVPNKTGGR